jgi:fructose-bisphosphate aldolase class II
MALVSMKDMLIKVKKENSPFICGVSEGAARYMGGFSTIALIVSELIAEYDTHVPVAIRLDHGSSLINVWKQKMQDLLLL